MFASKRISNMFATISFYITHTFRREFILAFLAEEDSFILCSSVHIFAILQYCRSCETVVFDLQNSFYPMQYITCIAYIAYIVQYMSHYLHIKQNTFNLRQCHSPNAPIAPNAQYDLSFLIVYQARLRLPYTNIQILVRRQNCICIQM